jgi:zinc transport system ATP-binding protein
MSLVSVYFFVIQNVAERSEESPLCPIYWVEWPIGRFFGPMSIGPLNDKKRKMSETDNQSKIMKKMPSIIEVDNVSFSFEKTPALKGITFRVAQGDYLGIVGPNGGGKSTLIKLLLGLLQPDSGKIRILGKDPSERAHRHFIGYVPQRMAGTLAYFPATVDEIVRSGRYAQKSCAECVADDEASVFEAMEVAGVTDLRHRLIGDLSGGQRQRVLIARALARKPKILILDEPLVGVDAPSQSAFYEFLKKLNRDMGLTILFVTHDLDVIASQANTVLCLNYEMVCHTHSSDCVHGHYLEKMYGESVKFVTHNH